MKISIFVMIAGLSISGIARAEEKNCPVKGMHCDSCVDMVKDKVCNDTFDVCDVTLNEKSKTGNIHIKTKDQSAKIDEKALSAAIADTDYKVGKCTTSKMKKAM